MQRISIGHRIASPVSSPRAPRQVPLNNHENFPPLGGSDGSSAIVDFGNPNTGGGAVRIGPITFIEQVAKAARACGNDINCVDTNSQKGLKELIHDKDETISQKKKKLRESIVIKRNEILTICYANMCCFITCGVLVGFVSSVHALIDKNHFLLDLMTELKEAGSSEGLNSYSVSFEEECEPSFELEAYTGGGPIHMFCLSPYDQERLDQVWVGWKVAEAVSWYSTLSMSIFCCVLCALRVRDSPVACTISLEGDLSFRGGEDLGAYERVIQKIDCLSQSIKDQEQKFDYIVKKRLALAKIFSSDFNLQGCSEAIPLEIIDRIVSYSVRSLALLILRPSFTVKVEDAVSLQEILVQP